MSLKKIIPLLAGPLAFLIVMLIDIQGLSYQGQVVLASTLWVGIWWMTEAVELEVTSLLPILLLSLGGAMKLGEVTAAYGQSYIFLFMGGFIIGLAVEKCGLHRVIAFFIINSIGTSPRKVILGFMVATGFLSMWISNTATAIMMLPIALSLSAPGKDGNDFSTKLLLGVAYSASVGGFATLIGTPPNIIFAAVLKDTLGIDVPFMRWMMFAFPCAWLLIVACWWHLTKGLSREKIANLVIPDKPKALTKDQIRVAIVFSVVAFMWVSRSFLINPLIPQVDDTLIAIFGAIVLFIIPSGAQGNLMDWNTAKQLPWGVLLMFGGGLAIAKGFSTTDLTQWMASGFDQLNFLPFVLIVLIVIAGTNFLTEMTSNTATASMLLPLLIPLSASLGVPPIPLMSGAVLAASCAFMLPVATPPNAVVFSSGKISIQQMMRTGFWMNLVSIALIWLFATYLAPLVF